MALLFFDGFDAGDYLTKYQAVGSGAALSSATRYGTGQCFTLGQSQEIRKDVTAASKLIVGLAFKSSAFSDSSDAVILAGDAGSRVHINLRVMASGAVALYRATTLLATSAAGVCALNTWHYLEISATVSDRVGVVPARVDGAQVATFTGDTRNAGTNATLDAVRLPAIASAGAGGTFWDDLYIADDAGAAPRNAFLGDVRVQTLRPNGAGNQTGLTPVGSATNWQNVDETPPSATDYNWSGVVGTRDLYTLEDLAAGTTTVYGVQAVTYAQKTDAATRSAVTVTRTGGVNYSAASRALTTTQTAGITVYNTHPAVGAEWTVADVNALETGIEVA